jgi:23S rRNA pseudouridine1911/1915/1917 synthase
MIYPDILYEDHDVLVINKPAGWVVHEGVGETGETIVDWFVKNHPEVMNYTWPYLNRVGIVHRLDKDTSGTMVIAKSPPILDDLQCQFKERTTEKIYKAIVYGEPKEKAGTLTTFMGRHPKRRQEQAILPVQIGEQARREAITEYCVEKTFLYKGQTLSVIRFKPKTGRMHQLRVHAKFLGTPILGDQTYTIKLAKHFSKELGIHRQLLHASSLTFRHPTLHKHMAFEAPLPQDMTVLLDENKPKAY